MENGASNSTNSSAAARSNRIWWQILALVVVSAVGVIASDSFDRELDKFLPESKPVSSSYNKKRSGLSGLFELVEKVGLKARAWELPYRQLSIVDKGTLVIIAPVTSLREFEVEQILKWVKEGNQLVYVDSFRFNETRKLLKALGLSLKTTVKALDDELIDVKLLDQKSDTEKMLAGVKQLKLTSSQRLVGGQKLIADRYGTIITRQEHGDGKAVICCCPSLCTNGTIADKTFWGNFQLLINCLSATPGNILFDERAHGFTGGTNVFLVLSRGATGLVIAQLLFLIAIATVSESQRFGRARKVDSNRKISNLEFVDGLANAYRRARANTAVAEILFHGFRNQLARNLAISPHEPPDKLVETLKQEAGRKGEELEELISRYNQAVESRNLSDSELKSLIETCDKIASLGVHSELRSQQGNRNAGTD